MKTPSTPPAITTLASAQNSSDTTVYLASAAGVTVKGLLFVDSEAMRVNAIAGTAISVQRGVLGTGATDHVNAATVYVGTGDQFLTQDPSGACSAVSGSFPCLATGSVWQPVGGAWSNTALSTFANPLLTGVTQIGAADTGIARTTAGVVEVNSGTAGALGKLEAAIVSAGTVTTDGWSTFTPSGAGFGSGHVIAFKSTASNAGITGDVGIARNAAGVLEVNTGTKGTLAKLAVSLPVYASDAAAGTGGLVTGTLYADSTGVVHVKQ